MPLGNNRYLSEVVAALGLPVIIVVNMRLGALNHALLTRDVIRMDGLEVAGWVANTAGKQMARYDENLASLKQMMEVPFLGEVPHLAKPTPAAIAEYLDLTPLRQSRG